MSREHYSINTVVMFCKSKNIGRKLLCINEVLKHFLPAAKMLEAQECLKVGFNQ